MIIIDNDDMELSETNTVDVYLASHFFKQWERRRRIKIAIGMALGIVASVLAVLSL